MQATLPLERTWTVGHTLRRALIPSRVLPSPSNGSIGSSVLKKRKVSPSSPSSSSPSSPSSSLCVAVREMTLSACDPVGMELRNFRLYRNHFIQRLATMNDSSQEFEAIVTTPTHMTALRGNDLMHRSTHLTSVAMMMIQSLENAFTVLDRRVRQMDEQNIPAASALTIFFKPVFDMTPDEKQRYLLSGIMHDVPARHQMVSASRKMTEALYGRLLHSVNVEGWKSQATYQMFIDYFTSWKYLINSSRLLLQLLGLSIETVAGRLNMFEVEPIEE